MERWHLEAYCNEKVCNPMIISTTFLLQGNLTRCIDPNRCYDLPPGLPNDFSVDTDYTDKSPDYVNTTLNYTCARQCKFTCITIITHSSHILKNVYFKIGSFKSLQFSINVT